MLKILSKFKWFLIAIFVLIIAEPTVNSELNFWLQELFNMAVPGTDKAIILSLLVTGFFMWMVKRLMTFLVAVLKARFVYNIKQELKRKMFVGLLKMDTSNILWKATSGEYISAFTNDIVVLEQRFFNQIINLVSCIFSLIILGTSFVVLNPKLASAIILFGSITSFVPLFFSKKLNNKNLEYSNKISDLTQALKEYLVSYPTIKNYAIESTILKHFAKKNRAAEHAKFEADYTMSLANSVGSLLSWFMQFIAVGMGLMYVINGEILIGTVISAQGFASDLATPLQEIIINVNSIRSVKQIVKKLEKLSIEEIVDFEKDEQKKEENFFSVRKEHRGEVVFEDVSLEIDGKKIIDHFSFCFKAGKKYLILGHNGSGKSSLFKILKKWFRNFSGRILIDGYDIHNMSSEKLSHIVSYLSENVSLFSWSVRDNISLFRDYNSETLCQAINAAQIHLNLERDIKDEGRNLSSGEQRRIEIARSLMNAPKILIFDEVVSTLDIETAYDIEELALGFEDKTVIFISHNFSGKLIEKYDEILIMDDGKLSGCGDYQQLIMSNPYFQRICNIKFGISKE